MDSHTEWCNEAFLITAGVVFSFFFKSPLCSYFLLIPTKPDLPVRLKAQKVLHISSIFFILRAQKVQAENPNVSNETELTFRVAMVMQSGYKEGHLRDTENSGFRVNIPR